MTIDINAVLDNANRDRKITITERKMVMDVVTDIQQTRRQEAQAANALKEEGVQAQWESACGANKVKSEIDSCFDRINSLNRQLAERGVKPVKDDDRLVRYYFEPMNGRRLGSCYGGTEVKLKITNKALKKKYDVMQANLKTLDKSSNKYDDLRTRLGVIVGCATVGEVIDTMEDEAPEIIGTGKRLTHKV